MRVCQGCLLSMPLYIIVTEVPVNFINTDKIIKGIQTGDHEIKIVNFADDTTIFLWDIACVPAFMYDASNFNSMWKCKGKLGQSKSNSPWEVKR